MTQDQLQLKSKDTARPSKKQREIYESAMSDREWIETTLVPHIQQLWIDAAVGGN